MILLMAAEKVYAIRTVRRRLAIDLELRRFLERSVQCAVDGIAF